MYFDSEPPLDWSLWKEALASEGDSPLSILCRTVYDEGQENYGTVQGEVLSVLREVTAKSLLRSYTLRQKHNQPPKDRTHE